MPEPTPGATGTSGTPQAPRSNGPIVLGVAAAVVAVVLALAVLTSFLPESIQELIFRTPLAILVIGGGTIGLLIALARPRSRIGP